MLFQIGDITIDGRDMFLAVIWHLLVTQLTDVLLQDVEPTANLERSSVSPDAGQSPMSVLVVFAAYS